MIRRRVVTLAALAAASVAAAAAPSAGARPADAATLRAAGWDVTWPYHADRVTVPVGSEVRVVVAPRARRPPAQRRLRVSLVRLDGAGERVRTVASRRLRRGTFRARLAHERTTYLIAVKAGRRVHQSWVTTDAIVHGPKDSGTAPTPPPALPQPPAPPVPPPPPEPARPTCDGLPTTGGAATLNLGRTAMGHYGYVGYTMVNTGPTCLYATSRYSWERLVDGAWQPVVPQRPPIFTDEAYTVLPGGWLKRYAWTSGGGEMPPGRYRLVVAVGLGEARFDTPLYAEIDVDANIPEAPPMP